MQAVRAVVPAGHAGRPSKNAGARRRRHTRPGPAVRRCEGCVELLSEERQQRARCRARRALAGIVHPEPPDSRRNRRQADSVEAGLGDSAGHDHRGAERQGCRRLVPARAAVPRGDADRMRHHLRVVPIDDPSASQHAVRTRPRRKHGRGLHESGSPGGRKRRAEGVSGQDRPDDHQHPAAEALGDTGSANRDAVGERAGTIDREMLVE